LDLGVFRLSLTAGGKLMRLRVGALTLLLGLVGAPLASAVTYNIDFDSFVPGVYPGNFLAAFGINNMVPSGAAGAGGPRIDDHTTTNSIIPSPPNVFSQDAGSLDPNQLHRLTLSFDPGLVSFGLTRVGKHSFGSTDNWSAQFFDSSNNFLGGWSEGRGINYPPKMFSFTAPTGVHIARMELDSVWTNFATHRNIPVDDFVLTFVPEPSSGALLMMGLLGLAARRRR
jgi:hypothetical protein